MDISYIHREKHLISFWEHWKLLFSEATASECFEHYHNLQRWNDYLASFLNDFIKEHWEDVNIDAIWVEKLYEIIRNTYFQDFFNTDEKNSWDKTPFYTMLDLLAKRVWDPYDFMEKRTWRQTMALIKGYIWNARAGYKDGDKANRDMLRKDLPKIDKEEDKKMMEDVDKAIDNYLKMQNAN